MRAFLAQLPGREGWGKNDRDITKNFYEGGTFMKMVVQLLLSVVLIASVSDAALRARYSYCINHDADAGLTCSGPKRTDEWRNKIIPGIWDGYDAETGFDDVDFNNHGSLDNAPNVTATYWVDSIFEPKSTGKRKDGPLFEGIFNEATDLVDPTYQTSTDGYIVYLAGHLNIETPGTYEFELEHNDGGILWIDANQDGEIVLDAEGEDIGGTKDQAGWQWQNTNNDGAVVQSVTFSEAGYTKIMYWYWDWGEVGHAMVKWTKPDGTKENIPASAFGKRRNFGAPVAHITEVKVDGDVQDPNAWYSISATDCQEVSFTASADNMLDETPVYVWNFGDGNTQETSNATVTHTYAYDPSKVLYNVSVQVKRGQVISDASSEVVIIYPSDDPNCAVSVRLDKAAQKGSKLFALHGADMYLPTAARGADVVVRDVTGRKVLSAPVSSTRINLNSLGLGSGYYMVSLVKNGVTLQSAPAMLNAR